MQEQFIQFLKAKSQDNTSFAEEIASVLDIGYDAAYRRINSKTSITLEEAVKLAKHYKISLNNLFEVGNQNSILTELSPPIHNKEGLEMYFKQSLNNVLPLTKLKSASIIYSAKDIPLFHTLKDSYLSRYKMYVWLKDVDSSMTTDKINFEDFIKTIPETLLQSAFQLGEVYKDINITEIWNNTTINGTLQQVLYYFESGALSKNLALKICKDIEEVIYHVEEQAIQQCLIGSKNKAIYHLYENDIHTMSNTIMVVTPFQKVFFTPFTVISYLKIDHQPTCELMYEFFEKQMSSSKLLVNAGEKDRSLFFKRMHQKIEKLRDIIETSKSFDFE
jgi:plasmid maintenance system antidote protein VapI